MHQTRNFAFTAAPKKLSQNLISVTAQERIRMASCRDASRFDTWRWRLVSTELATLISKPFRTSCHKTCLLSQPGNMTNLELTIAEHQPRDVAFQANLKKLSEHLITVRSHVMISAQHTTKYGRPNLFFAGFAQIWILLTVGK